MMIKIEKVTPLNESRQINLSDISRVYYNQTIKGSHTKTNLLKARNNQENSRRKFNINGGVWRVEYTEFIDFLINHAQWQRLFTATISELVSDFLRPHHLALLNNGGSLTPFGELIKSCFNYKGFRNHENKGKWLAGKLNIKACPYCNANYTLAINAKKQEGSETKGLFQFDHFFPRSYAPHLSLSLYNLIPSCANCNLIKLDETTSLETHYHPYHNDLTIVSEFNHWYDGKYTLPKDLELKNLHVKFRSKYRSRIDFVNRHNDMYQIDAVYERHKDVVKDLMIKSVLYGSRFRDQLLEVKGLFDGDERLYRRYLLGNYGFEDEIAERPLVKLTRDIAKDLKLIED